jgi:hypothetical protein
VPWTLIQSGFENLDDVERCEWEEDFEDDRQQCRDQLDNWI